MSGRWLVRSARRVVTVAAVVALVPLVAPGCSVGDGSGTAIGTLDVPDCWSGNFNLNPTFFAADPYNSSLTIRIQNGGDYAAYSDGISILVDNVHEIRGDPPFSPSLLNQPLSVSMPSGVTPPGVPVLPQPNPSIVHATVYLDQSCPTQVVALYAVESVSVDAQGNCNPVSTGPYILACNATDTVGLTALADAGDATLSAPPIPEAGSGGDASPGDATIDAPPVGGEAATVLPPNAPVQHSVITFQSLFDGNENEESAAQRLTQATFQFYLADPRDVCPGGVGPPPPCRGYLSGQFQFYFEVGQPGQPFP